MRTKLAVFGDLHFPWAHREKLAQAISYAKDATHVVQVGDLTDEYLFSKFPRQLSLLTPKEELSSGRAMAQGFWREVQRAAPRAKCFQLLGNHDARMLKRVLEKLPEAESLFVDRFKFDRVTTIEDPREELFLNGICFQHGYLSNLGDHAKFNNMNTVHGHTHRAGITWHRNRDAMFFEMDVGWLGDETAPVFSYMQQKRLSKWTTGVGLIDSDGPRFIPI